MCNISILIDDDIGNIRLCFLMNYGCVCMDINADIKTKLHHVILVFTKRETVPDVSDAQGEPESSKGLVDNVSF